MRSITKIGDVFSVAIDNKRNKYFQYIVSDHSQLNSDVIRVFKEIYPVNSNPALSKIIQGEVEFYAHCVTKLGLKLKFWEKVGTISEVGNYENVIFRISTDSPQTKISHNWWIWKINEEPKRVGKLEGSIQKAEIGSVMPPDSIVHRIITGKYDFVYPMFE